MATQEWHQFFDACLRKRLPPEKFQTLFKTFNLKHDALQGRALVDVLLDVGRKVSSRHVDPRIPLYLRILLQMEGIGISDVLDAISALPVDNNSNVNDDQSGPITMDPLESQNPRMENLILQMMTTEVPNGLVKSKEELHRILRILVKTKPNSADFDAQGYFISAILNTALAHDVLNHVSAKSVQTEPLSLLHNVY